jgi:hypothetical protein
MSDRKLYNVVARVVDLVWADSPEEASAMLAQTLSDDHYEELPDGQDDCAGAFVSEPVEEMGREGADA